jgi:cytochrome P450
VTQIDDRPIKTEGTYEGCPVIHWDNTENLPVMGHLAKMKQARELGPIVRNSYAQGFWMILDGEAIREAYQNPEVFSSSSTILTDPDPSYLWIPQMIDAPEHTKWRKLLQPAFAPRAMSSLEDKVEERCIEIIDGFAKDGRVNFMRDFAQVYPTTIFMDLMGLPLDGLDQFLVWEDEILHLSFDQDPGNQRAIKAMGEVMNYFDELIKVRRDDPRDDLLSQSISWTMDGEPIPHERLLSFCLLMFMAGLDTVTIQLCYSFWHLAQHPEDRQRIVNEPDLIPTAVEEFLRFYSFVPPSRKIIQDIDFHGCPMKAGEMVWLPLPMSTRDPNLFADADTVKIDRQPNNHLAFGAGPHRCLGAHLARRELTVAMREWHKRIPDYRATGDPDIREEGSMYGMRSFEVEWDV